jgi:hypothetical protein
MGAGLDILTSTNITRVAQAIVDRQTLPQPLLFYQRAAKPQVSDEEITLRQKFYTFAADIVSTDSKALIRDNMNFATETSRVAKFKHGFGLSESQALLFDRIENAQASAAEVISFNSHVSRNVRGLILGIQQRQESMLVGMLLDGYSYDRLGIKLSGTWGMPGDLKFNPATQWNNTAATPITDLITIKAYALRKYGELFNRITMSFQCLQYIVKTQEFLDLYKALKFSWDVPNGAIITADTAQFATVVGSMCGMTIETYDGMYREYNSTEDLAEPVRFLPENMVILSQTADDNNSAGWDFAQAINMEAVFAKYGGTSIIGAIPQNTYGIVSYTTQADPALNPAGMVCWAVDRGAPRKARPTCSARIRAWVI